MVREQDMKGTRKKHNATFKPTFPGFPVVVGRRIARSGVLGSGKRAPRPQEAVETAG
jgi:hypothetical protein